MRVRPRRTQKNRQTRWTREQQRSASKTASGVQHNSRQRFEPWSGWASGHKAWAGVGATHGPSCRQGNEGDGRRKKTSWERRRVGWQRLRNATVADLHTTSRPYVGIPRNACSGPSRETPPSHESRKILERERVTRDGTLYCRSRLKSPMVEETS